MTSAYFHLPNSEVVYFQEDVLRLVFDEDADCHIEMDAAKLPAWEREELPRAIHMRACEDEYLPVPVPNPSDEYEIMENFVNEAPMLPRIRQRFAQAIQGKGAFKRLKDAVARTDLEEHWYAYQDAAYRRTAREWCDANGIIWGKKLMMKDGRNS